LKECVTCIVGVNKCVLTLSSANTASTWSLYYPRLRERMRASARPPAGPLGVPCMTVGGVGGSGSGGLLRGGANGPDLTGTTP